MSDDIYYTIERVERSEIKIKGSRFIASAAPAPTKDLALTFLESIRSEFFDATHNCYAYLIGADGLEFRAADDGEPSGSAGKPIMFSIKKYGFTDIIVVVTRYFGGTKLGVGGLARAYGDSSAQTLELCVKKAIHKTTPVKIFCNYEDVTVIKKLIDTNAVSFEEYYADSVEFIANIHKSKAESFAQNIISATKGRAGAYLK